jgi:hypothetical protein
LRDFKEVYMKSGVNTLILVCLVAALLPALTLGAETPDQPSGPAPVGFRDLPLSRPGPDGYLPQSGTSKATLGTLSADADTIMSVFDFNDMAAAKYFGYVGVDNLIQDGLHVGFGTRYGKDNKKYFGISYGGSLINELAMLLTNQNVIVMKKNEVNTTTIDPGTGDPVTTSVPDLVDGRGDSLVSRDTP